MSDRQVSVDGQTRPLGPPFFVLATQNPYEFEGTYPLPESQLDRFLHAPAHRLPATGPPRSEILHAAPRRRAGRRLEPRSLPTEQWSRCRRGRAASRSTTACRTTCSTSSRRRGTTPEVQLGASTRAALGLYRAAQALALLDGRDYVVPDDIKRLAVPVLAHRLLLKTLRRPGRPRSGRRVPQRRPGEDPGADVTPLAA